MDGVNLTPLKIINNKKGDILHVMKKNETNFSGFGEAYFSLIHQNVIKGWKRHFEMTLNIVVVSGEIEFVIYNGVDFFNINLSRKNFQRLTVKPKLWFAFRGIGNNNILLNIGDIEHDPVESENRTLDSFNYNWIPR